jgi:hypothetical protein
VTLAVASAGADADGVKHCQEVEGLDELELPAAGEVHASGEVSVEQQAGRPEAAVDGQVQHEMGTVDDQVRVRVELRGRGRVRVGDAVRLVEAVPACFVIGPDSSVGGLGPGLQLGEFGVGG